MEKLGVVVVGNFAGAGERPWVSRATGESGQTPEVAVQFAEKGRPEFIRCTKDVLDQVAVAEVGQPITLTCRLIEYGRIEAFRADLAA